jgi:four helix bundle protein
MANTFEHLDIWKQSIELASIIYREIKKIPKTETFGIISQLQRAVVSISSNIAEGSGRGSKKDFCRFIDIAIGSLNEVESLLFVSGRLNYLNEKELQELLIIIKKLGMSLGAFRKHLLK